MSEHGPDLGEAVDYILSERPKLWEDDVWAIVRDLQDPPPQGSDRLAIAFLKQSHPEISKRDVKVILREWRAYASIARERDWEDGEIDEG